MGNEKTIVIKKDSDTDVINFCPSCGKRRDLVEDNYCSKCGLQFIDQIKENIIKKDLLLG